MIRKEHRSVIDKSSVWIWLTLDHTKKKSIWLISHTHTHTCISAHRFRVSEFNLSHLKHLTLFLWNKPKWFLWNAIFWDKSNIFYMNFTPRLIVKIISMEIFWNEIHEPKKKFCSNAYHLRVVDKTVALVFLLQLRICVPFLCVPELATSLNFIVSNWSLHIFFFLVGGNF